MVATGTKEPTTTGENMHPLVSLFNSPATVSDVSFDRRGKHPDEPESGRGGYYLPRCVSRQGRVRGTGKRLTQEGNSQCIGMPTYMICWRTERPRKGKIKMDCNRFGEGPGRHDKKKFVWVALEKCEDRMW